METPTEALTVPNFNLVVDASVRAHWTLFVKHKICVKPTISLEIKYVCVEIPCVGAISMMKTASIDTSSTMLVLHSLLTFRTSAREKSAAQK